MNILSICDLPHEALTGLGAFPPDTFVGLRPEDIATDVPQGVPATVTGVEYLGADQLISCRLGEARLLVRQAVRQGVPGGTLRLGWDADCLHLFDALTGKRLPLQP